MSQTTKGLDLAKKVTITKKGETYKPSANSDQANAETWALIQGALAKPQTVAELIAVCKAERNHAPFVKYCIRRGWLAAK